MANGERQLPVVARRRARSAVVALLVSLVATIAAGRAQGDDLNARLGDAETAVAEAQADVAEAMAELPPARERYAAASRRAVPVDRGKRAANRRVRQIEASLADRQREAAARVSQIEDDHRQAVEERDEQVKGGIAAALAALTIAAIALGWGWFRATAAVAWLSEQPGGQAIGLCVFGAIAPLVLGGAMAGADGVLVGAIGGFLVLLGLILPAALLLARHSAEIQRGRARPILGSERWPGWVAQAIAATMALLFIAGAVGAATAGKPTPVSISTQLRETAAAAGGLSSPALAEAEREARRLRSEASVRDAARSKARRELGAVRRQLLRAEGRLVSAKGEARRYTRRLAVIATREEREAIREEEEELETAEESCDPNYSGCLDPNASDYDCAGGSGDGPLYTGPVEVLGVDHYGLDADGDGYACEE
jgi:hypothetical protein